MPTWLVYMVQWVVGLLLSHLDTAEGKKLLAEALTLVDGAVQAVDARVTGSFKGVADEVAAAFHTSVVAIVAALSA